MTPPPTLFCGLLRRQAVVVTKTRYRCFCSFKFSYPHNDYNYEESIHNPREKIRAAMSLPLNPDRVHEIVRSVGGSLYDDIDSVAFSVAINNKVKPLTDPIRHFMAERNTSCLENERYSGHAMLLFGHANMIDHAIATFDRLPHPSVYSLNALLLSCLLANDLNQLKTIYAAFPTIKPNLDTYATVVRAFTESGESGESYSVLTDMDRERVRPNTTIFAYMLAGFYKEGRSEDVDKVLELMNNKYGLPHGVTIYNSRIQSLCELKRFSEAKSLFEEMLVKELVPNAATYCSLIREEQGDVEHARTLFKSMVSRGYYESALQICKESILFLDMETMTSLVKGLASTSRVAEARDLIEQVKHKVERWDEIEASLPRLETLCMSSNKFV